MEKPRSVHQRERADQRDRDGHERDQGGANRAQEQKDDEHDEEDGLADGLIDVLDQLGDEHRFVVGHANLHAVGQRGGDFRQHRVDFLRHFERVGGRLLDDAERDGRFAVEADDAPLIERAQLGVAHIGQAHEIAVGLLDDEIVELGGRAQIRLRQHGELALLALDAARRHLDILAPERRLDVLRRQTGRRRGARDRARCAWNIRARRTDRTSATPESVCS